jgi:hypothetical protein
MYIYNMYVYKNIFLMPQDRIDKINISIILNIKIFYSFFVLKVYRKLQKILCYI